MGNSHSTPPTPDYLTAEQAKEQALANQETTHLKKYQANYDRCHQEIKSAVDRGQTKITWPVPCYIGQPNSRDCLTVDQVQCLKDLGYQITADDQNGSIEIHWD